MLWRLYEGREVQPKFLVNGCPKHGLHLLAMLVEGCAEKHPASIYNGNHWIGTFRFNSFAPVWQPMERWFFLMSRLQQSYYMQGHVGWRQDIADFLRLSRIGHVFIVRDLRDVAVSQAYHILDPDNRRSKHGGKSAYHALGGFEEILKAVIVGLGPYPGVAELFEVFAPWLEDDHVHLVRFEEAIADLESTAAGILEYGLDLITTDIWEAKVAVERSLFDKTVEQMVAIAAQKEASPTFRHGVAGDWREAFTEEHVDLFKQHDRGWLVRLGYETDEDWGLCRE